MGERESEIGKVFLSKTVIEVDRRFVLTFSFVCAYNEIVVEVNMVFVYSVVYHCRLNLRGETCLKTMFLDDTLGLGRLFCYQAIQLKEVIRMAKKEEENWIDEFEDDFYFVRAGVDLVSGCFQYDGNVVSNDSVVTILEEAKDRLDKIKIVIDQINDSQCNPKIVKRIQKMKVL